MKSKQSANERERRLREQADRINADDLRNAYVPCGDCGFDEENVAEIEKRLINVERLIQLRNEEDVRMAERFDALREGQKRIENKTDANTEAIHEVRDIAMQNSHDLNNGLKSKVIELATEQELIARRLAEHVLTTPTREQREEEIKQVHESEHEERGEKRHRTIEKLAVWIGVLIALDTFGLFDFLSGWVAAMVGR